MKIHKYAGVLSAYGIVLADVVVEQQEAFMQPLNEQTYSAISKRFEKLEAEGRRRLDTEGYGVGHNIHVQLILRMRYERTDCALTCSISADQKNQALSFLLLQTSSFSRLNYSNKIFKTVTKASLVSLSLTDPLSWMIFVSDVLGDVIFKQKFI